MGKYDYLVLSSDEFELLCKDIIEAELGIKFENFKSGKDGGIDLRYAPSMGKNIIVQCKRYQDFKNLESTLKKEVEKVKKLNPDRYIFMTSVPLNPNDKEIIKKYIGHYIKSTGDIFGKDEIDTILENHHSIERKHYKLWLASTNIISAILHNDVFNRSKFTEEQIKEKISLYVTNESYYETLKHLEKSNVIILSGGPGVGKTTLADMIYLNFSAKGYEFIEISEDIDEGERLYETEKKQLFYYDDFLGRNFLNQRLAKNEDRRIINFLKKIMLTDNKIFIMTTREYILKQAQINHDLFDDRSLDFNKYILDVEKYTNNVKAKILYNHLYFSSIPKDLLENFIKQKSYLKVIEHRNYNPRLISRMTRELEYEGLSVEEYPKRFIQELEYPYFTWQHIYENQITDYSRWILLLLMVMGDKKVILNHLEDNFNSLNIYFGRSYKNMYFRQALKELEKTFIRIENINGNETMINFFNPSVADFLIEYNSKSKENLKTLWKSSIYIFPMLNIFSLSDTRGKIIVTRELYLEFQNIILHRFEEFKDCQYTYQKVDLIYRLDKTIDLGIGKGREVLIKTFNEKDIYFTDKVTDLFIKYKSVLSTELDLDYVFRKAIYSLNTYEEFRNIRRMFISFPEEIQLIINEDVKEEMLEKVTEDINDYLNDEYDYDEVVENMRKFGDVFNVDTKQNIDQITEFYRELLEEMQSEPDYEREEWHSNNEEKVDKDDYIEDLFESLLYN